MLKQIILPMETNDELISTMNTKKVSVFNNALKYGIYTSLAYVLLMFLYYVLDLMLNTWMVYASYIVIIGGIILATLNYRDKINDGYISYGKGVITGVIIGLVVGIVMAIFYWVFYTYINPNGMQDIAEMTEQTLVDKGFSDEMIDQQMEASKIFMKMPLFNLMALTGFVFWGLIISLITSAILKKNDDSFNATFNQ